MTRDIADSVVVITGASSGIGRATALQLAQKGASVVLAGRRKEALDDLAGRCQELGGAAIAHAVDVTDEAAVQDMARRASETFGRIDVWVNNAAVTLFGRFENVPSDAFRRVIETNLFGCVHGSRAALPYFRRQGHGVLINVSSIAGEIGQPFTSPYVASKWAVRGFSESLRMELSLDEEQRIKVCTVLPASIDTPLFQHAANYSGRQPKPMRPIYDADKVASTIVGLIKRPQREVSVGGVGPLITWQHRLTPALVEAMMARQTNIDHFQQQPADDGPGNLWEPMWGHETVSGKWKVPSQTGGAFFAMLASLAGISGLAGWLGLRTLRRRNQKRPPLPLRWLTAKL
jgi:NAD(P)-dependent dehydrogenase (short-subunit alcohol dehydrogenase family)